MWILWKILVNKRGTVLIDKSGAKREDLWQNNLDRCPSAGFDGTSSIQRDRFIAEAMEVLRSSDQQPDRDLISDIVTAVSLNDGHWPKREPVRTIRALVERVINAESEPEPTWRWAVTVLQAMLLEFADRIENGNPLFNKDADSLVAAMLAALRKDLVRIRQQLPNTLAYRLALMMAANYSAIPSRKQRAEFISVLRRLIKLPSDYNHPFLEDLVLIYEKMDLGSLDRLWENASA